MRKRRAGFGLRHELMYRVEKLLGNVANLLLYDYSFCFETLKNVNILYENILFDMIDYNL